MFSKKIIIITLVSIILISSVIIYNQIPRYAATVNGPGIDEISCGKTLQHGFFSEYPILEKLILNEIKNPDSRLKLKISLFEFDTYKEFMIGSFGEPNPECFYYEYNNSIYPLRTIIGPASYFTHSFYP